MTVSYWLRIATNYLQSKSIPTARLDCLVLLEDVLRLDRAHLLAEPTTPMTDAQVEYLQKLLNRRAKHEPLAYIRGKAEFYGRSFVVTPAVLVPRPESETMISLLKQLVQAAKGLPLAGHTLQIADIGTGSGALGITAKKELPGAQVDLLDIDSAALLVAKTNVDLLTAPAHVMQSDLLEHARLPYDILLCNLPYVPDDYPINKAATKEPKIALFAGPDGLDVYRQLFEQLIKQIERPLYILTEAFPDQHKPLRQLAKAAGYQLSKTDDFIQVFARKSAPASD